MATYEVSASGVSAYKVIMDVTVSGTTVTVSAKWRRDSYAYSSFSGGATWKIVIDGTVWTDTWDFSGPAGGSISTKTLATRSKNVGVQTDAAVQVVVDFDVSPGSGSISKTVNVADPPDTMAVPGASSSAAGKVDVTWVAPGTNAAPVTAYQIGYKVNGGAELYVTASSTARSYQLSVSPGASVSVRVRANSAVGYGGWSGSRSATAKADPPSAPGGPSFSSVGTTSVGVSWAASTSTGGAAIDGYLLRRNLSSPVEGTGYVDVSTELNTSRTASGLAPATRYYFAVYAHNNAGFSVKSAEGNVVTLPAAPAVPTVAAHDDSSVALSWTDSNGGELSGYDVQVADNASFSGATTLPAAGKSLTVGGLNPAVTYYFRVRAKASSGTSDWSAARSQSTAPEAPDAPTAPQPLTTSLGIAWTDANGAATSGYDVQWSTAADFSGATTVALGRVYSYTIQGLNPGTVYYVRVRAKTAVDVGAWSPTLAQTTLTSSPPNFSIVAGATGQAATLTMSLSGVPSVTSWRIERRVQGTTTATTLNTTANPYMATGLAPGTTYEWRVSAFVGTYQSPWSDWTALRQPRPNTSPGDYFDGSSADTDDVDFRWLGTVNNSVSEAVGHRPDGWYLVGDPAGAVLYRATGGVAGIYAGRVDILADQPSAGIVVVGMDDRTDGFWADVAEGGAYAISAYVNPSKVQVFNLEATWCDETGAVISTTTDAAYATAVPADEDTRILSVLVAPHGAVRMFGRVTDYDDGDVWTAWRGGDSFLVDAAMITLSASLPYFDGSTVDTSAYDYAWLGAANASASVRNVLAPGDFDPLADPDCPMPPAAPRPPAVPDECIEDVTTWRRYWAIIPAQEVSTWLDVVPTIDITTGDFAARQIRIRFHRNPDALAPSAFPGDQWESEQIISYLPPHATLTLDGVASRAWATVAGSASLPADRLLYGSDSAPATWPLLTCGDPYLISFDVPLDAPDGNINVDVALTQRAG